MFRFVKLMMTLSRAYKNLPCLWMHPEVVSRVCHKREERENLEEVS